MHRAGALRALQQAERIFAILSVGTVRVIKLIRVHFELDLDTAASYVNRCVFEREKVDIPAPSAAAVERFLTAVAALPRTPRVVAALRSV